MKFRRISYAPLPLEWLARGLARLLYRADVKGAEHVPPSGGALIVANHLSYADVVAVQLACPRPMRFIGYRGSTPNAFFDWVFRRAGVIALTSDRPGEAVRAAIAALQRGEVICLFPEGMISRTGQLMELQRGFELIARKAEAPVIPAAIDGLWGSLFSFSGNRYLWKSPRLTPTPVRVHFGAALTADRLGPEGARRALMDLGADAFAERPALRRHLGWSIARALARRPGRVVIVDCTGERRAVTAAQLFAVAAALARRLRARVPERRVGIALPPGAGCMMANLAVLWAGKVPVNLNFTVGRAAAESALQRAGIETVLTAEVLRAKAPDFPWPEGTVDLRAEIAAAKGGLGFAPWFAAAWLLPNQWAARAVGAPREGGDAEAAILFTSGSAGLPKGVVLTHRNILANCAQFSSLAILPKSAVILGCLPIFHSFGFTITLWYPLLRGCGLVTVPSPLDTRRVLDAIREEKATVLISAPTFLRGILKKGEPRDLRSLDLVVAGAERLPEDLRRGFIERFQVDILQGYGLTETSPVTNVNQPDPPVTTATAGPQKGKRTGTVGRLLPGVAARIIDPDTGADRPLTATGLLCFRGANVFGGYLGDAERTAEALRDGWFVTGDLAHFDAEGFLTIAGRRSRFSKIGGEMVPHGVVEQKLAEAFGLDPGEAPAFAVAAVPDPAKGEALVLLASRDVGIEEVREKLTAAGLPNLWIPKIIRRVPAIPMLPTGKLDLAGCARLAQTG